MKIETAIIASISDCPLKPRSSQVGRLVLMLGCLLVVPQAWADIYTYTDKDGVIHLSNHAMDEGEVVLLKDPAPPPPPSPTGSGILASRPYSKLVDEAARKQHLDGALIHAVIAAESAYNPTAVSPKGARGLMQLMPETARRYGVANTLDPAQNIQGGTRYLKDLMQRFNDNLALSLAAYNAGENAVEQHGNQIPPYRETRGYVSRVLDNYHALSQ